MSQFQNSQVFAWCTKDISHLFMRIETQWTTLQYYPVVESSTGLWANANQMLAGSIHISRFKEYLPKVPVDHIFISTTVICGNTQIILNRYKMKIYTSQLHLSQELVCFSKIKMHVIVMPSASVSLQNFNLTS